MCPVETNTLNTLLIIRERCKNTVSASEWKQVWPWKSQYAFLMWMLHSLCEMRLHVYPEQPEPIQVWWMSELLVQFMWQCTRKLIEDHLKPSLFVSVCVCHLMLTRNHLRVDGSHGDIALLQTPGGHHNPWRVNRAGDRGHGWRGGLN